MEIDRTRVKARVKACPRRRCKRSSIASLPNVIRHSMLTTGKRRSEAMRSEREVDLLIAGAGPAGMTAALVASLEGLDVLLVREVGSGRRHRRDLGRHVVDPGQSPEQGRGLRRQRRRGRDLSRRARRRGPNRDLREAFLQTGPEAIDYLEAEQRRAIPRLRQASRLSQQHAGRGGYRPRDRRRSRSTAACSAPTSARCARRSPNFMVFGGMMVGKADIARAARPLQSLANFVHAAKLFARYLADRLRYPRGTRLIMGNALVARLFSACASATCRSCSTPRSSSSSAERTASPARAINVAARKYHVKARKGVVLATGGYRAQQAIPRRLHAAADAGAFAQQRGNAGDGLALGAGLGARIAPEEHGRSGLWTPVSVTRRADGSKGLYPASDARPRQAGPDRGQRRRTALCQRGGLVSRLRRGDVRRQRDARRRSPPI